MEGNNILIQAFLNVHGQTGLPVTKQKQIEDFIHRNKIDILHCQEINIDEDSFSQCKLWEMYLHSDTDGVSRGARENDCSETI